MKIEGITAVITGASAGIGAATAVALAQRGARRLVLMARRADALAIVAEQAARHGAEAQACGVDLADPAAVDRAFDALDADGFAPDLVVLSAGAGRWLYTEETEPAEAVAMMAVPYFAAFFVARRCLPGMLARRRGRIAIVNSPVARGAWPGAAGYTAARYALQGFTNALRMDLHGTGVGVTSLVPGKVESEYFARNPGVEARIPAISRIVPTLTAEQAAQALVRGVERDQVEVIVPWMLRVFFISNAVAPWLVSWLLRRTGWQRPGA